MRKILAAAFLALTSLCMPASAQVPFEPVYNGLILNGANGGTLSGTAVSNYLASPPCIGCTTPAAIAATTLSASGTVSGAGFTALFNLEFASPPCLGCTTPGIVDATTLNSTLASSIAGVPINPSVTPPGSFSPPAHPGFLMVGGVPLYTLCAPTSAAQDTPAGCAYTAKDTNYTGIPSSGSPPAGYFVNNIHAGAQGPQEGITGFAANGNTLTSQPGGTSGGIGVQGIGSCVVSGCTATWGGVFSAYGFGAANPTHPLISLELDNYDVGTDANGSRVGLELVCALGPFAGTPPTCTNLFLVSGTAGNVFNYTGAAVNGLNFIGGTFSGNAITTPGFHVDGSGNAFPNTLGLASGLAIFWGLDSGTNGGQIIIDNSSTNMFFDDLAGGDAVFRTTGFAEVARIKSTGILNITGASGFAANGSVATVLGSLGPVGSHTTVQRWHVIQDAGVTGWIPVF